MRSRRFACLLLGMWLAGSLLVFLVNARSGDLAEGLTVHHSPEASLLLRSVGYDGARLLFRYYAAEQTRDWREDWEDAAIILAAALFLFLLFGTREGKAPLSISLAMLILAVAQRTVTIPEVASFGRITDLVPAAAAAAERDSLAVFTRIYQAGEALEWLAGCILAAVLMAHGQRRSKRVRREIDMVDKADYGHVDR